jgi:hypothetical protein
MEFFSQLILLPIYEPLAILSSAKIKAVDEALPQLVKRQSRPQESGRRNSDVR